jgi:hypothetical protein
MVQLPVQPHIPITKLRRIWSPPSVCTTSGWRVLAGGQHAEALGQAQDAVAVAHPDLALGALVQALEERVPVGLELEQRAAVLVVLGALDQATELVSQQLQAVADAEDRHVDLEHLGIDPGRVLGQDARGSAGQDQPGRGPRAHLVGGQGGRMDLAVDVLLANSPGDQLGVLGTEIEDQDAVEVRVLLG